MAKDTYTKLIELLDEHKAHYRLMDHEPEGRTEIVSSMRGNKVSQAAKCIIMMVKIGKKETKFVLGVVPGDAKVNLDAVKKMYDGSYISFATPEIAEKLAGCVSGTVLPFSFHPELELIVDPELLKNEELFFNAARLDRSMVLKTSDYEAVAKPRVENIAQYDSGAAKSGSKKTRTVVRSEDQELDHMRHSCAHILAQAVLEMFPEAKLAIGPTTEDGFYYDLDLPRTLIPEDLALLQEKMERIAGEKQGFKRVEAKVDEAIDFYKKVGQVYKVEIAEDLKKEGEEMVTFYENVDAEGKVKFSDLCRGGHTEHTGKAGAFQLTKIAGAYWRGDEKRPMLQRVYGLCFKDGKALRTHVQMLEEAKKRDHRKLGKELDLFTFSDLVGPGLPLWTPKGTVMRNLLDDFVWELRRERGYERVTIPHVTKKDLYEKSGHWEKFANDLFRIQTREEHEFAMKPMNCPHHTQIYNHLQRSYKDLPQRYAETTMVYRDEQTGELHGLTRVRSITQDDAHVFCRRSQVKEEFLKIWDIIEIFYKTVGFGELRVRLSLHDPEKFENYLGTPELWGQAEESLREIAREKNADFIEAPGEAAFYGPKVDFIARDSVGREWQVATIQLDINMPERFDLFCINEGGEQERIVMVHAAIMGAIERFMAIFIEHHAGAFPVWVAPIQVTVLPVSDKFEDYAREVAAGLKGLMVRVTVDDSNEGLGKKIRAAELQKIPYMLVVGEKEVADNTLAVRSYKTKKQEVMSVADFTEKVTRETKERAL